MPNTEWSVDDAGIHQPLLPVQAPEPAPDSSRQIRLQIACVVLNVLFGTFELITFAPTIVLFERSLCRKYYDTHDTRPVFRLDGSIDEQLCKIKPIQQQLAFLRGWKAVFDSLPVFVIAMFLGRIADLYGRKTVLMSSIFGLVAGLVWIMVVCHFDSIFPIHLVWLSAVPYLCGSFASANAMIYTIAADSTSELSRTQTFYYIHCAYLLCQLIGPTIASATIEINVWIPFGIALSLMALCIPILLVMPETYSAVKSSSPDLRAHGILDVDSNDDEDGFPPIPPAPSADRVTSVSDVQESFANVLWTRNFIVSLSVLLIGMQRQASLSILLQYAPVRFGLKISTAALFHTEVAIINITLFLLILPPVIRALISRGQLRPQSIDWMIILVSLLILALGAVLIGLAPSVYMLLFGVGVYATGFGIRVTVLSLITTWSGIGMRARAFGAVQIAENIGKLCAEPILMGFFAASFNMPALWQGLPFFVTAVVYLATALFWALACNV